MNAFFSRTAALLACFSVALASFAAESIDTLEKSASEWVKLRVETARLESDWRSERDLVTSMAAALKERADAVEEKRDLIRAKMAKEREELGGLQTKTKLAKEDLKVADERLKAIAQRLVALRPHLPPRLSDALELAYRSLSSGELPIGERMQVVMAALNRCAQFNRVITLGEEVIPLEGESAPKSVQVIYWGLSHGYALEPSTRKAWRGAPGPTGWKWQAEPEAFASIGMLIAIAGDRADPEFVTVPAAVARALELNPNQPTP